MRSLALLATPLVVVWLLAGAAEGQADGDFWWLRESTDEPDPVIPTEETPEAPPCECVKYYLCINGTISTSGVGLIDIRLGGGNEPRPPPPPRNRASAVCPDLYDVCCNPPTTPAPPTTTPAPTLPPNTPCDCVAFLNCTAERIVSDGKGNTTLEAFGIYASHSACPHAFSVCCAREDTTPSPVITSTYNPAHPHCDCVETYHCDSEGNIMTSGAGFLDMRTFNPNPNPDIECEDRRMICCNIPAPEEGFTNATTSMTNPTTTQTTPSSGTLSEGQSCGSRNELGIAARVLGFSQGESQFGEFPWVAAVLRRHFIMDKPVQLFVGGGTLIHPRVVITAAHKLNGIRSDDLWVRLGEWDTQTTYEAYEHQTYQVEEVVLHPQYDSRALFNDIAILILKEEVEKQPHIGHICLAEDVSMVDGSGCVINGWGKDGFEETDTYQTIMKSLTLPLVERQFCQKQLRKTRLGRYFRLHKSFLCAGGELGKDACTGDGGGPLACPRKEDPSRYLLVGITAWGIGCGQDGLPGVYASIPANYHWILNETYVRYPTSTTPIPTTTSTTEVATTTTDETSTESYYLAPYEQEEEDAEEYYYSYEDEWEAERKKEREERKKRKQLREERRERKKRERQRERREREERKRRRERRRQERLNREAL